SELVARSEIDIEFGVGGIADLRGGKGSSKRGEMSRCGEDEGLIAGFIITGRVGSDTGLGLDRHGAIEEFDDIGDADVMLIETAEEEDFIFPDGPGERGSALLLAAMGLEGHHRIGGAKSAVANVIETGAVPVVGAGLGDNVDDGAAGASLLRAVGIGGDAELLDDFVGELVGGAVKTASLGEEGVVEVAAIDEEAVLKSAQAAERKIAISGGGERARILRDAGREEHEIGKAAAVEGEIGDGAFIEESRDGAGLGVDEFGSAGNGECFFQSSDGEVEIEFGGSADIDVESRSFLG